MVTFDCSENEEFICVFPSTGSTTWSTTTGLTSVGTSLSTTEVSVPSKSSGASSLTTVVTTSTVVMSNGTTTGPLSASTGTEDTNSSVDITTGPLSSSSTQDSTASAITSSSPNTDFDGALVLIAVFASVGFFLVACCAVFGAKVFFSRKDSEEKGGFEAIDSEQTELQSAASEYMEADVLEDDYAEKPPLSPLSDAHLPQDQIQIKKRLGAGMQGDVYLGKYRMANVALKVTQGDAFSKMEVEVLKAVRHPNVVVFLGTTTLNDNRHCIVMELLSGGSMLDFLRAQTSMTLHYSLQLCIEVGIGLDYLQGIGLVHADVAARNILIQGVRGGSVKVGDFGLAKIVKEGETLVLPNVPVPVRWSSPEVLSEREFSRHSDVWSFGVLLWEVFSFCGPSMLPYPHLAENNAVRDFVCKGNILGCPGTCPAEVYSVMKSCFAFQPEHRPSFEECINRLEGVLETCEDCEFRKEIATDSVNHGLCTYSDGHSIYSDVPLYVSPESSVTKSIYE